MSYSYKRLAVLAAKFNLHVLLNSEVSENLLEFHFHLRVLLMVLIEPQQVLA